jgi:purine-binding chemotaxis protein CheW
MSEASSEAPSHAPDESRAPGEARPGAAAEPAPKEPASIVAALSNEALVGAATVPEAELLAYAAAATLTGPDGLLRFADALAAGSLVAKPKAVVPELSLVGFSLDETQLAVPIARVVEILRVEAVTRVPGAPPELRGVTNVRGRVVPVVELRTRLLLPPAEISPRSRILLVEAQGRVLGLLVDAVDQVRKVPVSSVLEPPSELRSRGTDYVRAVARLDDRLIILIDLDRALSILPAPSPAPAPVVPEETV